MELLDASLPVICFCGNSGSGKTTIIEKLLPRFKTAGLNVGYLKHGSHKLEVDKHGKDTERIFSAGADMLYAECYGSAANAEGFARFAGGITSPNSLFKSADIILAEGFKNSSYPKLWVNPHDGGKTEPAELKNMIGRIGGDGFSHDDIDGLEQFINGWLLGNMVCRPLYGGLLIGGKSRRMGQHKSMLTMGGITLAERAYGLLSEVTEAVYLLGNGALPDEMQRQDRLADSRGAKGPLAGILSAHRFAPMADWFILAVDMPLLSGGYLHQLASGRKPMFRIIAAENDGRIEATCAIYSSKLLSQMDGSLAGDFKLQSLLRQFGAVGDSSLYNKKELSNLNSPEDMAHFGVTSSG